LKTTSIISVRISMNIFLSYSSTNAKKIALARTILEAEGNIVCWDYQQDQDVLNDSILADIEMAISKSDYVLFFWSHAARSSGWILSEWRIARRLNKRFVLIKIDDADFHPEMNSGDLRYIAYSEENIVKLRERLTIRGTGTLPSNTVATIMTPKPDLLEIPSTSKAYLAYINITSAGVRHLLVAKQDGTLDGFMSIRDILKKFPPRLSEIRKVIDYVSNTDYQRILDDMAKIPITRIMTPFRKLISVTPDASILEAIDKLTAQYDFGRISALPVVSNKRAVGVVSYIDILCKGAVKLPNRNVGSLMVHHPIFVDEETELGNVYIQMDNMGIRHMPIVDAQGYLSGMIDDITCFWLTHPAFNDLQTYPVKKFMRPIERIQCLVEHDSVLEVVRHLFCEDRERETTLPVVENRDGERKKLVGIISYIDVLNGIKESHGQNNH
ncbi:MAG TPA: CBS domain-containing protein, partial [Pseudothermotoga sp.]